MEHEVSNNMMMTTEGSDLRPSSTVESDMVTREQIADLSERTLEATEMGRNNVDGDSNSPSTMDMIDSVVPVSPPALTSIELAKQSRELVGDYIDELSADPEKAVTMASDFVDGHVITTNGLNETNGINTNGNHENVSMPLTSSVYAFKNSRQSMEDRHIVIHDLNKALELDHPKHYSYYAVFDGHAGYDAANYASAHLHHNLVSSHAFREGRVEDAFKEAFKLTDQMYLKRYTEDSVDPQKASGTTALVVLIEDNKKVYIAWAGDSQAVLVRQGRSEEITIPHRPDLEKERLRITEVGGLVVFMDTWRLNGVLSVSRAIGDPEHRPYLIADPDIVSFEIDPTLDFLVLGSDGLFDQLSGQDIAAHVFEYFCRHETEEPQKVIESVSVHLSSMAAQEGSSDNITTIVLFFKPFDQLVATGFPSETAAHAAVNSELHANPGFDNLDLKPADEETVGIESAGNEFVPLSTTNGGHFPYTDFGEMPIGANYKITKDENNDGVNGSPVHSQIDRTLHVETSASVDDVLEKQFYEDQFGGNDDMFEIEKSQKSEFNVDNDYNNQKERLFGEGLHKEQQQQEAGEEQQLEHDISKENNNVDENISSPTPSKQQQVEVEVHHSAAVVSDPFAPNSNEVIEKKLFDENFEPEREKILEPNENEEAMESEQIYDTKINVIEDMATFVQPEQQQSAMDQNPFAGSSDFVDNLVGKEADFVKQFDDFDRSDIQQNIKDDDLSDLMKSEVFAEKQATTEDNQSFNNSQNQTCFDHSSFISTVDMTLQDFAESSNQAGNVIGENFINPLLTESEPNPVASDHIFAVRNDNFNNPELTSVGADNNPSSQEKTIDEPEPVHELEDCAPVIQQEAVHELESAPLLEEAIPIVQSQIVHEHIQQTEEDSCLVDFVTQSSSQPLVDPFGELSETEHHNLVETADTGMDVFNQNFTVTGTVDDNQTRDLPKFEALSATNNSFEQTNKTENDVVFDLNTPEALGSNYSDSPTAHKDLFASESKFDTTQAIEDDHSRDADQTEQEFPTSEDQNLLVAPAISANIDREEETIVVPTPEILTVAEKQHDFVSATSEISGIEEQQNTVVLEASQVEASVPASEVKIEEQSTVASAETVVAGAALVGTTGLLASAAIAAAAAKTNKEAAKKPTTSKDSSAGTSKVSASTASRKAPITLSTNLAKPKVSTAARVPVSSRAPTTKPLVTKAAPTTTAARVPATSRVAATKPVAISAAKTSTTARAPATTSGSRLTTRVTAAAKTTSSSTASSSTLTTTRKPLTTTAAPKTAVASSRVGVTSSTTRTQPTTTTTAAARVAASRAAAATTRKAQTSTSVASKVGTRAPATGATSTATARTAVTSTSRVTSRPATNATTTRPGALTTRVSATKVSPAPKSSPTTKPSPAAKTSMTTSTTLRAKASTTARPAAKTTPTAGKTSTPTPPKENGVKSITGRKTLIAGGSATKTTPTVPTNGISNEVTSKSSASDAATKTSPSFSKRMMGVENSLKQELEDAVLNELNNSAPTSVATDNGLDTATFGGDGENIQPTVSTIPNPQDGLVGLGSDPLN